MIYRNNHQHFYSSHQGEEAAICCGDEETDLERNGALLTDAPRAPDRGEGTFTFSPLNWT